MGVVGGITAYAVSRRYVPKELEKALGMTTPEELKLPLGMKQELKLPEASDLSNQALC